MNKLLWTSIIIGILLIGGCGTQKKQIDKSVVTDRNIQTKNSSYATDVKEDINTVKTDYTSDDQTVNNTSEIIVQDKTERSKINVERTERIKKIDKVDKPTENANITTGSISNTENNKTEIPPETIKGWWNPTPGISWQLQLQGVLNSGYNASMYDIDLFDNSKETISGLHQKGIKVICYFSAGSYEDWRDDKGQFPKEALGSGLEGWEGEQWLDVSKYELFSSVMENRMNLAVEKGCDGVDPDNLDGYANKNGIGFTYQDQLKYNKWLSKEAHKRGLAIGLKNDLEQIDELADYFDFAINEQCFAYDECNKLIPFIQKGKAVFGVEYDLEPEEFCVLAKELKFSWLKMNIKLDGGRKTC